MLPSARVQPFLPLLVALTAFSASAAGSPSGYADTNHFYLENDYLKIGVLRNNGCLDGIVHKQSGVNLQGNNARAYRGIWSLSLNPPGGPPVFISPTNATSFTGTLAVGDTEASLRLTWRGLSLPTWPGLSNATVTARITMRADSPLSFWSLEIKGLGTTTVTSITYPYVAGLGTIGASGEDDLLLLPTKKGTLYHNPAVNVTKPLGTNYPSGNGLIQLLAYFDPTAGVYLSTDDTQGNTKDFWAGPSDSPAKDFTLNLSHITTGVPADMVGLPYNVVVGATQGDWYVPAETYRQWAVQQTWTQQSRKRPIPGWLRDNPISSWNCAHGCGPGWPEVPYTTILKDTQRAVQKFGTAGMLHLTGWEKFGAWVEGDYFPPAEGWAAFDTLVASVRPQKLWLLPSALFLDTNTSVYKSGAMKSSTMLDLSGQERTEVSAALNGGKWIYMDISTDPWRQSMIDAYAALASHGADLLQFDSSMVMGNQDCFNPQHAHPPGKGGNWQTNAWIDLMKRVGAAVSAANPNSALSAEEPAEIYLPYVAAHWGSGENYFESNNEYAPYAERVPMYQYVYHDVIPFLEFVGVAYGDGSSFRLASARNLVRGESPAYQMQRSPNSTTPAADEFMRAALQARTTYGKKFLSDGVMLPAPLINSPMTTVQWIVFEQNNKPMSADSPSIAASAWRAADDTLGIVMTNVAPSSVSFSLPVSFARLGLAPGAAYTVQTVDGSSTSTLEPNLTTDAAYPITLQSMQILLVTLTRKPTGSPATIAAVSGDGQRAAVDAAFSSSLQAVVKDALGAPVPGVTVKFVAPSSGASGSFTSAGATATAVTDRSGIAIAPGLTANGTAGGPYPVAASVAGVAGGASFFLTNTDPAVLVDAVVNAQSGSTTIAPNTWVEIDGANFTPAGKGRTWQGADFTNGQMPTSLDGVSVTVDGKPAFVNYISPKQINILTPPDAPSGLVEVKVTRGGSSASLLVLAQATSPSFFVINGGPYVLGTHSDGTLLGPSSLYPGVTSPAHPGETIVLYGNGFGATNPQVTSGAPAQSGSLPSTPAIRIGGIGATVRFAGVISPGLYQFNVVVPPDVLGGDTALVATYTGSTTQAGVTLAVER